MTLIDYQIKKERDKESPFTIDCLSLLKNCEENLRKYSGALSRRTDYVPKNKQEGQYGIIKEYNEDFKQMFNYDILADDDDQEKKL